MANSAMKIAVPSCSIRVRSGAKGVALPGRVINDEMEDAGKGKQRPMSLIYDPFLGDMQGPSSNLYNAPEVDKTETTLVEVFARANPAIKETLTLVIEPDPLKVKPPVKTPQLVLPRALKVPSGGNVHIPAWVENGEKSVSFSTPEGRMDVNGDFSAPNVQSTRKITVEVVSNQYPTLQGKIPITVEYLSNLDIVASSPITLVSEAEVDLNTLPISVIGDGIRWDGQPYRVAFFPSLGRILANGKYKVPKAEHPGVADTIQVVSLANPLVSTTIVVDVTPVLAPPPKVMEILCPNKLEVPSGGTLAISAAVKNGTLGLTEFNLELNGSGHIEEHNVYHAPPVYSDQKVTVTVRAKEDPTVSKEITVTIKALKIVIKNRLVFIYAGTASVNLGIEVKNDPAGFYNFDCVIISGEGEITSNGIYTPPKYLTSGGAVVVEVVSNSDANVKLQYSFILYPPRCLICGEKLNVATGECPNGHDTGFIVKNVGRAEKSPRMRKF